MFVGLADGVAGPATQDLRLDPARADSPVEELALFPNAGRTVPALAGGWTRLAAGLDHGPIQDLVVVGHLLDRPHPGADGGPYPLIGGVQAPCAPPERLARRLTVGPYPLGISSAQAGSQPQSPREFADDADHGNEWRPAFPRTAEAAQWRPDRLAHLPGGNPARDRSSRARSG